MVSIEVRVTKIDEELAAMRLSMNGELLQRNDIQSDLREATLKVEELQGTLEQRMAEFQQSARQAIAQAVRDAEGLKAERAGAEAGEEAKEEPPGDRDKFESREGFAGGDDPWKGKAKGKGKGDGAGKGGKGEDADSDDPELRKSIWERKGFEKRVQKFSNEKAEQEFRDWVFDLKKVTKKDKDFHDFLRWLEELQDELTEAALEQKKEELQWVVGHFNEQLYGVLSEVSTGRAKNSVIAREGEPTINGAILYREFARQHLNASQEGVEALGVRLTRPTQASMDTFEERLVAWDQDKEKYKRMTQQDLGDLSYIYLQDMMPDEVKARFEPDKHNIETIGKLRSFFTRMISDNKSAKK